MEEAKVLEEMKRLAGTQTEKNLRAAFAGESQAHVRYNLFAAEAEKDPSISRQIADIFRETGANEKAHAKLWFWLVGDLKKTTAEHPFSSETPANSNITLPGLTTATQYSGEPLPAPIRVSAGFLVTGL